MANYTRFHRRMSRRYSQVVCSSARKTDPKQDGEAWKDTYFAKHSEADANKDGKLTWPEYKAYRAMFDPEPAKPNKPEVKK